jgi:hypothetical protein
MNLISTVILFVFFDLLLDSRDKKANGLGGLGGQLVRLGRVVL